MRTPTALLSLAALAGMATAQLPANAPVSSLYLSVPGALGLDLAWRQGRSGLARGVMRSGAASRSLRRAVRVRSSRQGPEKALSHTQRAG